MAMVFTPHDAFVMLKDFMGSPEHRIFWAEGLHRRDDQDYAIVENVRHGFPEYVVAVAYKRPAYDALWRLIMWNNWRLDAMKKEDSRA